MRKVIDLTGKRFGRWTAVEIDHRYVINEKRWICRCDCGNIGTVGSRSLRIGASQSCGCLRKELVSSYKAAAISGQKFGRLVALQMSGRRSNAGQIYWKCRCDCGIEKEVVASKLMNGHTRSCGCVRTELSTARIRLIDTSTHGHSRNGKGTGDYQSWHMMIQRCTNPKSTGYKHYGARGVQVCDRWLHSFETFLEDLGRRPGHDYCLGRNGDAGDYKPGNVAWVLKKENSRLAANRRWGNS